jgi:signal peptidase I
MAQETVTTAKPTETEPQPPAKAETTRNGIAEWAVTILLLLFGTSTLVQAFVIPTGSMEDTLLIGDHLLVDKLAYAPAGTISKYVLPYEQPKHGDIIVFRYPADISQTFVKRVIGVPGDRIKLVNQRVYRNGTLLNEPYVVHKQPFMDSYRDNFPSDMPQFSDPARDPLLRDMLEHHVVNGEVVVPADHYFAMGDNRDNSLDSRYWGFVPRQNIIGKPIVIYWSYDAPTEELAGNSANSLVSHLIDLGEHFFTRTRWNRTLMLIRPFPDSKLPATPPPPPKAAMPVVP